MNDDRISYHWQDHVISPQRAAANLMATALVVLAAILVGVAVLIPLILGYTAWAYWVFRGKVTHGSGYH